MAIARIAFGLSRPCETYNFYNRRVWDARARPLTEQDYYQAATGPRDGKRTYNDLNLGFSYTVRHAMRNGKAGNQGRATLYAGLTLALLPVAAVNIAMGSIPGFIFACGRLLLTPWRPRSEIATREDVLTREMFAFSRIVGSFATVQQYGDAEHRRPVSTRDLMTIWKSAKKTIDMLERHAAREGPRLQESRLFRKSLNYLKARHGDLGQRIEHEKMRKV